MSHLRLYQSLMKHKLKLLKKIPLMMILKKRILKKEIIERPIDRQEERKKKNRILMMTLIARVICDLYQSKKLIPQNIIYDKNYKEQRFSGPHPLFALNLSKQYIQCFISYQNSMYEIEKKWKLRNKSSTDMNTTYVVHKKVQPRKKRFHTEMDQNINTEFVKIINQKSPNHFNKFFNKNKQKHQAKFRTLSKAQSKVHEKIFDRVYLKQKDKMMAQIQNENVLRLNLKKRLGMFRKTEYNFHDLNKSSIFYFQKKDGQSLIRGKYNEKMHPLCKYYTRCADQTYKNYLQLQNPFLDNDYI